MSRQATPIKLSEIKVSCRECTLAELCLPRSLDDADIERLDRIVKRGRAIQRGEHLFKVRDPFHALYAVRSGSIKVCLATADGEEQVLGFHLPGELLGLDGFETGQHGCAAVALETTTVCALPIDRLEEMCTTVPGLQHQVYRLLGHEIAEDHALLLLLGKKNAEARLASFLLSLSERYERRGFSPRSFQLSMSRHDIGNYLGLALETVSRQFARFQEDDLISVETRAIRLHDRQRLRALAGASSTDEARQLRK